MPDESKVQLASAGAGDDHAGREIEVKLEAPPAVLRDVFALAPFGGAKPSRGHTFETTYFDTRDHALSRAGLALRVRRAGRRRIMTLKWSPRGEEGFFTRGECEAAIEVDAPEPALLGPEAAAMVEKAAAGEPLVPVSRTVFRRATAMIAFDGALIEAARDAGWIHAGERKSRICELELELRSGPPAALFDFAASLTNFDFRVAAAPKGLRGHWLATGERPSETRAIPAALSADSSIDDVIAAILDANLKQFVANWPALSPELPEAVHQMRVALRRLRSALALFNRAIPCDAFTRARAQAKRIASAMGPARDQDVLADLVAHGPAEALGMDQSFEALLKASARKRSAAYKSVEALIAAPETSRFVLDVQAMIARRDWRASQEGAADAEQGGAPSARAFAGKALDRLDRRARRRGKNLAERAPEERHEARIALKNLRYGADFFAPLFARGRGARKFMRAIGDLQDALGAYNDSVVARTIVAELEQAAGAAARAGGAVAGWAARGAADADAHLGAAWKTFRKAPRFWR